METTLDGSPLGFSPLSDRLLVERHESEESVGGIALPSISQAKAQEGTVVAAGPGRRSQKTGEVIPLHVKRGQTVIFGRYANEVSLRGREFVILREDEVLAVVSR